MNALDYALIVALLLSLFVGFRRGFVVQILGIVGVALGLFLAARFDSRLASMPVFEGVREHNTQTALVIAFLVIFFLVAALTSLITTLIRRKIRRSAAGGSDRWLGGLVGLAKGVLILGGVAIGLKQWALEGGAVIPAHIHEKGSSWVADSTLIPWLADGCLTLVAFVPRTEREKLVEMYIAQKKEILEGQIVVEGEDVASRTGETDERGEGVEARPVGAGLDTELLGPVSPLVAVDAPEPDGGDGGDGAGDAATAPERTATGEESGRPVPAVIRATGSPEKIRREKKELEKLELELGLGGLRALVREERAAKKPSAPPSGETDPGAKAPSTPPGAAPSGEGS